MKDKSIAIVRYNTVRLRLMAAAWMLALFGFWFGASGIAGPGRKWILLVASSAMLIMGSITTFSMLWRRRARVAGRRGELVIYRYFPWPGSRRLVGDLRDVEMISPARPFPRPVPFKTLMKRQFSRIAVIPPEYTIVRFVFDGSAGSLDVDDAVEWIEHDFSERFDEWKRMQG